MKKVLTIAGSDCSGGAGIQADIKTMQANGVYAMSVITALTAQNTVRVAGISKVAPDFLELQLESVFSDIYPDAVKIGMVADADLVEVIERVLKKYRARHIVVDTVMVSTSGSALLAQDAQDALAERLLPLAELATPNLSEAERLSGIRIEGEADMVRAAKQIGSRAGCSVLLKGGHLQGAANDYLWQQDRGEWFRSERIDNPNTHGTGCTLSSAIAANLAKGMELSDAVLQAKRYLTGAIAAGLDLGHGKGPVRHYFFQKPLDTSL